MFKNKMLLSFTASLVLITLRPVKFSTFKTKKIFLIKNNQNSRLIISKILLALFDVINVVVDFLQNLVFTLRIIEF